MTLNFARSPGGHFHPGQQPQQQQQQQNNVNQQRPSAARKEEVLSYGAYLLEPKYKRVDKRLRYLVARCLCDRPAGRPRLSDLKSVIASVLRNTDWDSAVGEEDGEEDNSDAAVRQWVQINIGDPPGPPDPPHWVDTDAPDPWPGRA
jgi:hypothetical protein